MKTIDQLREYFNTELRGEILPVEAKRKGIVTRVILAGLFFLTAFAAVIYLPYSGNWEPWWPAWSILLGFVVGVLGFVTFSEIKNNREFYNDFKSQVIERIVKYIDPSFTYISNKHVPPAHLVESRLFSRVPKKYKGDDYVFGTVGGGHAKVEFSEAVAKAVDPESKNLDEIFKGLFFAATVDHAIAGQTYVVPAGESADTLMTGTSAKVKQVSTGNSQFDSFFSTFSTGDEEAKRLLTPEIQQRLVDFRSSRTNPVRFAFIGNKIYVAVWHEKDLFEPNVFKTLLDFGIIEEYYDDLYQAITIVEQVTARRSPAAAVTA